MNIIGPIIGQSLTKRIALAKALLMESLKTNKYYLEWDYLNDIFFKFIKGTKGQKPRTKTLSD